MTGGGDGTSGGGTASGGGAATGGGATTGGGTGLMPPTADRCDTGYELTSGVPVTVDPATYARDYLYGVTTVPETARDLAFSIDIPNGTGATIQVAPQVGLDVAIGESWAGACPATSQFANLHSAGGTEVMAINGSGGLHTVLVYAWGAGSFTITATASGTRVACGPATCGHGCCIGDVCDSGDFDGACGAGGAACDFCTAGERCRERVCVTVTGTTGGVCGATSQCYEPIIGTRSCSTGWPSGGACRSTCTVVNSGCGGTSAPGYCVNGECLVKCTSPGSGRSNCATGYLCDYSDPLVTTSQGICVPECGLVSCSEWGSGTCQSNGLCR